MSKKSRKKVNGSQKGENSFLLIVGAGLAAIIAVVFGASMLLFSDGESNDDLATDFVPEVIGAPNLVLLDDVLIDHGDVQINDYVDSEFRVRNTGDQTLILSCDDRVQLIEGC
jgi:hypothetical protein